MHRLATKRTTRKRVEENVSVSFFTTTRVLIYSALLTVEEAVVFSRHASVDLVFVFI